MSIDVYPPSHGSSPNAVLGYTEITASQTAVSTKTDIPGLAVTVFVPAGRRIRITGHVLVKQSVAEILANFRIAEGGVTLQLRQTTVPLANLNATAHIEHIFTPTAGTHTYTLSLETATGTVQALADPTWPSFILVEDITGGTGGGGPIHLGYAEILTPQASITTEVDLAGSSVTVTVPAGRRLRISGFTLPASSVASDRVEVRIHEDGVRRASAADSVGGINFAITLAPVYITTPTAGTHTYKMTIQRVGGTGSITNNAGVGFPSYLLVEDITGTPVPGYQASGIWVPGVNFPSSPAEGDLFYETDTDKLWTYNGAAWVEMGRTGAWTTYTPTVSNITLGNGTLVGRWTRMGRTIFAYARVSFGSTSSVTARPGLGVPVAKVTGEDYVGMGFGLDGGATEYLLGCRWLNDTTIEFLHHASPNGVVNTLTPINNTAWGAGDALRFMAIYEAAASV